MNKIEIENIPVIDFSAFSDSSKQREVANALGESLRKFGFVAISNHGIDPSLFEANYNLLEEVFKLPSGIKNKYKRNDMGNQRGYLPLNGETHPDSPQLADYKECWQIGRGSLPNIFPEEVPDLEEASLWLFHEMECIGIKLMEALDLYLGADGYLKSLVIKDNKMIGTHLMRNIHYPPITGLKGLKDGLFIRAAEHLDLNMITLLPTSTNEGLEILKKDRTWLRVNVPPNCIIINACDMLHAITKGLDKEIPSTLHRVVGEPELAKQPRYSIPFFVHPSHLLPLTNLKTGKPIQIKGVDVIEAGIYVYYRLKAILKDIEMPTYEVWKKENLRFIVKL
jgi:isopenicillin N synthase-like dioxygenase